MQNSISLPAVVADKTLRLASRAQFKVLLWFASHSDEFDVEACAAAVGESAADCKDALLFWQEMGVLTGDGQAPAKTQKTETTAPPVLPTLSMKTVESKRPQFPDVVARQKTCPDFNYLLRTAEERLGRPVSHGEMQSLLYIYDSIHLPAEVILMILVNAIQKGKVKAKSSFGHYLEKVAISWSEAGITTIAAAEEELCREEKRDNTREHMRQLFAMDRTPTLLQVEAASRWINEWGFSDEVLLLAFQRCKEKTGALNTNYMSRLLESWHADGIKTPDAAKEALEPKKKTATKPLLSDNYADTGSADEYEQAAAAYRPKYKKKTSK